MSADSQTQRKRNLEVVHTQNAEDETCRTFVMMNEDHTLGNALRYVVLKNPEVEFCGYSVPHPSENKINFRIQTKGAPATEVLRKGLTDLNQLCEHVLGTFERKVEDYKQRQHGTEMETDND